MERLRGGERCREALADDLEYLRGLAHAAGGVDVRELALAVAVRRVRRDVTEVGGRVHLVAHDAAHSVHRVLRDRLLRAMHD